MDAKEFRKKMEALYEGSSTDPKKQDDKHILRYEKVGIENKERMKDQNFKRSWDEAYKKATSTEQYNENLRKGKEEFWKNAPSEHRQHITETSRSTSTLFESKEQAEEIFWKCWGADRGEKLYDKLAKEYNVGANGIINLVRGHNGSIHYMCPVDSKKLTTMKKEWEEKYNQYQIIAKTSGKDLLKEYDALYEQSEHYKKVNLSHKLATPSVVYHCRFNLKDTTPQTVRDYCDSIGIPRIKNDLGLYKQILNDKFLFLTQDVSQTYTFNSYDELAVFLTKHPDNKDKIQCSKQFAWTKVKTNISWRGNNFLGWIFRTNKEKQ